jgi:hypothetical protein
MTNSIGRMKKRATHFLKLFVFLIPVVIGGAAVRANALSVGVALPAEKIRLMTDKTPNVLVPVKDPTPKLAEKERRQIEKLIADARSQDGIGARMKLISARLLGSPYIVHPLKGSLTEPEEFVVRMDGFDCVTYIETVLALAGAQDVNSFLKKLRTLRYADGEVSYATRLHYTTDWSKANIQRGYLQDVTQGADTVTRTKVLSRLAGFQPRAESFRFFPKAKLAAISETLQDGDLIYFISARQGLDTYHVGLVFWESDRLIIRHAARSKGKVVEQPLAEFIKVNRMAGFIVARPLEHK